MNIEEMDLSVRSYNCLKRVGIDTIEQLSEKTEDDLHRIRNLGKQSIGEIIRAMEVRGYVLKAEEPLDAGNCVTCSDIKEQAKNYQALYSKAAQERDAAVEKLKGTVPLCEKFEQMIVSAERYAFGRRTYIVSDTCAYIRQKQYHICAVNGYLRLTAHLCQYHIIGTGFNTACIHQHKLMSAPLTFGVNTIPGNTRGVLNYGETLPHQFVKQRGFAYIRTADHRYYRK